MRTIGRLNPLKVGMVKLASGSPSAAPTVDIGMTSYTAYPNKFLIFNFIPATDGVVLSARVSTDGGSTYDSAAGSYRWIQEGLNETPTSLDATSVSDAEIELTSAIANNLVGNASNEGVSGHLTLYDTTNTAKWFRLSGSVDYLTNNAAALLATLDIVGIRVVAQDTDAIRLQFSSGNMSGTWTLYGYV